MHHALRGIKVLGSLRPRMSPWLPSHELRQLVAQGTLAPVRSAAGTRALHGLHEMHKLVHWRFGDLWDLEATLIAAENACYRHD